MGFPRLVFRKADTPARDLFERIIDSRLGALGMSWPCFEPRNLTYAGSASSSYADWSPATGYTFTGNIANSPVRKYGGYHWVLHTSQPPLADFPGIQYWRRCLPLLGFSRVWGDVTKTNFVSESKALFIGEKNAGNPVEFFQYAYWVGHSIGGSQQGLDSRTWLDANAGWLYCDGEAHKSVITKTCTLNGTATVACADTSGLTPHMHVYGGGLTNADNGASVKIGTITANVSFTLLTAAGAAATGVPNAGSVSLSFSNKVKPVASTPGDDVYNINPSLLSRRLSSSGDNYIKTRSDAYKASGTYADYLPYLAGFANDDIVPQGFMSDTPGSNTNPYWPWAQDPIDDTYSSSNPTYGTGHHRLGVLEHASTQAAWDAYHEGVRILIRTLRTQFPHFKMLNNGGVKHPAIWNKQYDFTTSPDMVLLEGWGGWYSPESGDAFAGWESGYKLARYFTQYGGARRRKGGAVWNWKQYDDDGGGTAGRPVSQPLAQDYLFALCSTLLTDATFSFSYLTQAGAMSTEQRFRYIGEEVFAPIGVPVEDPPESPDGNGVLKREYQNGLILCRPKSGTVANWATQASVSFTLPFDCRRLTGTLDPADDGSLLPAGTVISMPPRSGLILLRA